MMCAPNHFRCVQAVDLFWPMAIVRCIDDSLVEKKKYIAGKSLQVIQFHEFPIENHGKLTVKKGLSPIRSSIPMISQIVHGPFSTCPSRVQWIAIATVPIIIPLDPMKHAAVGLYSSTDTFIHIYIYRYTHYIYIYIHICVCACMCVIYTHLLISTIVI